LVVIFFNGCISSKRRNAFFLLNNRGTIEDIFKRHAGLLIGLLAIILDGLIVSLPISLISYFITGNMNENTYANIINFLYILIVPVIWYGYTIGKKITGIRIAKVNGEKLGLGTMILRLVVTGLVYGITLGIGVIVSVCMVIFRKDKRSLHDIIVAYVTYERTN
jgi:uncharacterized RDD family membrane protein YckC